ncbi:MAG: pseudouridine synthase, partial [Paracoccus sp. (in: a-proteobacteria)]|nr:pseudouridine synthase [Paracoccus sp. (in: a-proteobacteria)]
GKPLDEKQETRLWLYYKPVGLVTSESDEKGRQTVFDALPRDLPRVMSVGRLDLNSEGLLLLTNDGELKRRLELPATGWLRRYRVRVNGQPNDLIFKPLRDGPVIDGEEFQPMEIKIDSQKGANAWLTVGIREGRNREIRRAMAHVGLMVNRLIRIGYGPFRLTGMEENEVKEVRRRVLKDQLGGLLTGEPDAEAPDDRPARGRGPARDGDKRGFGGRDGERKPFGGRDGERKPFGARDGEGRGSRPRDGERKPYGQRDGERGAERKPYAPRDGERKPYGERSFGPRDGERKPYGERGGFGSRDGERGGFKPREGERKSYAPRDGERNPYGERGGFKPRDGEARPFTPRGGEDEGGRKPRWNSARRADVAGRDGERKPYAPRDGERGGFKPRDGERKPYARRDGESGGFKPRDGERKPYGERGGFKPRDGERKPYGPRDGDARGFKPRDGERKPYGER